MTYTTRFGLSQRGVVFDTLMRNVLPHLDVKHAYFHDVVIDAEKIMREPMDPHDVIKLRLYVTDVGTHLYPRETGDRLRAEGCMSSVRAVYDLTVTAGVHDRTLAITQIQGDIITIKPKVVA